MARPVIAAKDDDAEAFERPFEGSSLLVSRDMADSRSVERAEILAAGEVILVTGADSKASSSGALFDRSVTGEGK